MKLEPWEPDLNSLYLRYKDHSLDLQPAFQRGLVWPREKKARLVDTVLRGWRVPPVHLVVEDDETLSVLDGQQRLQALFDFLDGEFAVGNFPPDDAGVREYRGLTFNRLPLSVQRRVLSARVSTYRLYEFEPDEPYELFFRLNLPTGLTPAEKRNALAGETRSQIREVVERAEHHGWGKGLLGFSDGRLAYDDVVARLCAYLNRGSIGAPLTARDMENLYRDSMGLPRDTLQVAHSSVELFTHAARQVGGKQRFNKATLLTWLLVSARAVLSRSDVSLSPAIETLEGGRTSLGRGDLGTALPSFDDPLRTGPLISLYIDRASLRVADVLSVQTRDAVAWLAVANSNPNADLPPMVRELKLRVDNLPFKSPDAFEAGVLDLMSEWNRWSELA